MANLWEITPELVEERFEVAQNYANSAYETALLALASLEEISKELEFINATIAIDTTTVSADEIDITPPEIDETVFRIDMPDMPTEPQIVDATIETFPEYPELVVGDIPTISDIYVSSLLTAIKTKLLNDVNSGGTGISSSVQDDMFNLEYERALSVHNDTMDEIGANWSKRGFSLPDGVLVAAYEKELINYSNHRLDISRNIAIKSWELAFQHAQFIIQQGIVIESQLINWTHSVAVLAFQVADAVIKNTIAGFSERRQGIRDKIASILEKSKAKIQYNVSLIELFTSKINAFSAQIRGESERINAVARGYEAEVSLFKGIGDFEISKAGLDLKVLDTRITQAINNANILIKDKEIEIKNYEVLNSLKIEVMKATGQIAAQLAAGAMSGTSVSATLGVSDQAQYNYGSTETHTYEEKKMGTEGSRMVE